MLNKREKVIENRRGCRLTQFNNKKVKFNINGFFFDEKNFIKIFFLSSYIKKYKLEVNEIFKFVLVFCFFTNLNP